MDRRIATEHDAYDMTFIPCDVSSKTDVFDAVGRAVDLLGGLDGPVHAAPIAPTAPVADISVEAFVGVMGINARDRTSTSLNASNQGRTRLPHATCTKNPQ